MENKIFEIIPEITSPISLVALAWIVIYFIYKLLLKQKILSKLGKEASFEIASQIIRYLFYLALVTIILNIVIGILDRTKDKVQTEEPLKEELVPADKDNKLSFKSSIFESLFTGSYASVDSGQLSISSWRIKEKEPFPILSYDLVNRTGSVQIINQVQVKLTNVLRKKGSATSSGIIPLAAIWDIPIPLKEGIFSFVSPAGGVPLKDQDVKNIELRLFCRKNSKVYKPSDLYHGRITITFITDLGEEAESEVLVF